MSKLNSEAINEITYLLNEVKDIVKLLSKMGIYINSDAWSATSFDNSEDILWWNRKNFEQIKYIDYGDKFYIGGNVITGSQHQYKDKWIIAPRKLAEIQGEIFKEYLQSIIDSIPIKHFKLELMDEYGLIDNCGWEHWLVIATTVKKSALETKTKLLNTPLNDYKNLLLTNGELNYKTDAGQNNKEIYEYSGYVDYLEELCKNYKIEFDKNKIDWEWCNYIQNKTYELEKKLEKEIGIQ